MQQVLASKGAEVVLAVRDTAKANAVVDRIKQQYPDAKLTVMELDLSSLPSVRAFADAYKQSGKPLNILICNAGVMAKPISAVQGWPRTAVCNKPFGSLPADPAVAGHVG